jgi:glucose-6-phosphate 1-dehydrogenase
MNSKRPTILVIIGITGDLSKRKLLPAIEAIARSGYAPESMRVVGVTRGTATSNEVLGNGDWPFLRSHLETFSMDLANPASYVALGKRLDDVESGFGEPAQRLFYLSIPPQFSRPVVQLLGEAGFGKNPSTKLLLEKPFGVDLGSARELIDETTRYFSESQIYRIDHYLAKEMAQNIVVFRQGNALFRRTWNNEFIERIDIVASEKIGIEGRAAFYEQTGALRDLVQSHLLQLAALTLMELPDSDDLSTVPHLRHRALASLRLPSFVPIGDAVHRAQYRGYREEVGNNDSTTETFVDVTLESTADQWRGVPIRITTGKALKEKATKIRIVYKKSHEHETNELVISLQPNESVAFTVWSKVPGYDRRREKHSLEFGMKDHFNHLPEAYEQVIVDAMNEDHELFASSDEVLESWRIIEPIQTTWGMQDTIIQYKQGADESDILKNSNK